MAFPFSAPSFSVFPHNMYYFVFESKGLENSSKNWYFWMFFFFFNVTHFAQGNCLNDWILGYQTSWFIFFFYNDWELSKKHVEARVEDKGAITCGVEIILRSLNWVFLLFFRNCSNSSPFHISRVKKDLSCLFVVVFLHIINVKSLFKK